MANTNLRTGWNVGVFVLPIRNKVKRLREKLISGASAATGSNRSAHSRGCCESQRDGRAAGMVSTRAKSKSIILDQKAQEEIIETQYWMNREVRWK